MEQQLLESGLLVPESGIYKSILHEHSFDIALIRGHDFPECAWCKRPVQFELVRAAPYAFEDPDLAY